MAENRKFGRFNHSFKPFKSLNRAVSAL